MPWWMAAVASAGMVGLAVVAWRSRRRLAISCALVGLAIVLAAQGRERGDPLGMLGAWLLWGVWVVNLVFAWADSRIVGGTCDGEDDRPA